MRARRRFGQHFLRDAEVLDRIVEAINPDPKDRVVEIGPGHGALTERLLQRLDSLTAIEIDRDLAAVLRKRFSPKKLTLHTADALDTDFTALCGLGAGPRLRIVGNLPYNISTPLLFHLLTHRAVLQDMHVMLQKEVVDRMAAEPGSKTYGRLTVMLAPWVRVEPLFTVGPEAFTPAPKVDSTVARLHVLRSPAFEIRSPERFEAVVRAAFTHRRKTLRNSLKSMLGDPILARAAKFGVDPFTRAEEVSPQQYAILARL